jgi:glycosyltransferase involved in cell wall biosynthesis
MKSFRNIMKADLHVHSKFSKRPSQWVLKKIGCAESYTEPLYLYKTAREKGMSLVTITDHNTISGALEIAHLPHTFIGEEVTTYFPEDRCKIHVLVYGIDEGQHEDIQKIRENIYDLVQYLRREGIVHAVAHPLYSVNDRLTVEHFEELLLLFKNFEVNGARDHMQNQKLQFILSQLTPAHIERLVEKHDREPQVPEPWKKNLTGGSDDHSSLNIARTYTEVEGCRSIAGFLRGIEASKARAVGRGSSPQTLAYNIYGIAYQFYRQRFRLERHVHKDILLRFLDRFLCGSQEREAHVWTWFYDLWNQRKRLKTRPNSEPETIQCLFRHETQKLIWEDPALLALLKNGNGHTADMDSKWFDFVNKVSNKVLVHFGNNFLDQVSGADFFNVFHPIGSAGALYSLLAPYFVSFSLFTRDRKLAQTIMNSIAPEKAAAQENRKAIHIAHFTDTFYEINGVALSLRQQVQTAMRTGKNYTLITCDADNHANGNGIQNFRPIGVYELPVYREQKLLYPPFLQMLNYCYEGGFTHIHSATPGPIGLAALAIARILDLPLNGTYHTSLPQYAQYLTQDDAIEELTWKYVLWYYDQMDLIFVPSHSTARELEGKGIHPEKIRLIPRGIDIERFHPSKGNTALEERYGIQNRLKLLYVGRVSKEKDLPLLVEVFKSLVQSQQNISLIIVGDGPYLKEMRQELRGTPTVFTGYLQGEELPAIYASCDLFVFPSTTDTFGNVVLEAQACGLPVIVTDSGGPQENLIVGKTGVVVPASDGDALFVAIQGLLTNPNRLKSMAREARQYMEERSFEKCFEQTWQIYQERSPGSDYRLAVAV